MTALTLFLSLILKVGCQKLCQPVSLAHAMRAHPHLLFEDLHILVIDLDPQSSATMFLNHKSTVRIVNTTSTQAMLQNVTREELLGYVCRGYSMGRRAGQARGTSDSYQHSQAVPFSMATASAPGI